MNARIAIAWEIIIVAAATVAGIVIPAELVLGLRMSAGFHFVEAALTLLFSLDILFRFYRLFSSKRSMEPAAYPLRWLLLDLLAAVPFYYFPVPPAWRLLRLVKFARLFESAQRYWRRNIHQSLMLRLMLFSFWLVMVTHWFACGWLATRGMNANDVMTEYIASLYFCITVFTTVGFGDITPVTSQERLLVISMEFVGVGIYGFIIGNVASVLTKIDPARQHYIENVEKLNAFVKHKSLPGDLRKRLAGYYAYLWEQRLGYDESSIISALPPSLKTEVSLHLRRDIIQKVPLFKGADEAFVRDIALQITPVVYLPGDYVVVAGEEGNEMYFVSSGELEVVSKDGQTVFSVLGEGDFFGEIALLFKQPRSASVRATTYCDLYRLERDLFERVLLHYPDVAAKIEERAKERNARG